MASREARRMKVRKNQNKVTDVEVKRQKKPILYGFSVAIITVVAIAFIFTMVPNQGSQSHSNIVFGSYAGKEIKYVPDNYFAKYQKRYGDQIKERYAGQEQQDEHMMTYQAWKGAFDQTVRHLAIETKFKKSGFNISEDKILGDIVTKGPYLDEEGNFDKKKYEAESKSFRDSTREYFSEIMVDQLYTNDVYYSQKVSQQEIAFLKDLFTLKRNFRVILFSNAKYPREKVVEFARNNMGLFRKIKLSKITLKTEEEANDFRTKIADGSLSFEEVAKNNSLDNFRDQNGSMGSLYFYEFENQLEDNPQLNAKETADAIYKLDAGGLSQVISLGPSWVIFKSDSKARDIDLQNEDDIKMVRENYLERYAQDILTNYTNEQARSFKDKVASMGFEKACKDIGQYPPYETEYFSVNYLNVQLNEQVKIKGDNVPNISSVADNDLFFQTAFALKENEISEPIVAGENTIILKLISEKKSSEEEWKKNTDQYDQYLGYLQYGRGDYTLSSYGRINNIPSFYLFTMYMALDKDHNSKLVDPDLLKDDFSNTFDMLFPANQ
ncbi:MAG: SurA N-terminal domain-containing protein [Spirochaetales bacterium]|nr:SurA N-terminal domain-containing protein [Spirochaetales bacterium]